MQKIHKAIISLILVALFINVIPFKLFAQSTYLVAPDTLSALPVQYNNKTYEWKNNGNNEIRSIAITDGNTDYLYFVSLTRNSEVYLHQVNGSGAFPQTSTAKVIDSDTYYYYQASSAGSGLTPDFVKCYVLNYGTIQHDSSMDRVVEAIYYTFGDGAVQPVSYGELIVGFHTNFSASGTNNNYSITSNTNLDTIEWENIDANGNDLQNKGINVQIRAVPILYSANSKSALDLLGFQDAVVNYNDGLILWTGNFNDNHKSFIWNDVINQLQTSNPAFAITSLLTGSVWTRYGWIYQIRYNDVLNDYTSEWQTIYNSTSIKVSDSEKIVNQYYYHYPSGVGSDDQNIFHDINTVNNTTNNWYVNDVPVDPDASWLDSLIQAIAEILGKILDFFSSIFDGLVDLILGLFGDINPADNFFNWFSNLFNGIGDIDLSLPEFNLPNADLSSFNRLVQETLDIFSLNNFGFVIFIPLLLLIIKAVF